MPTSSEAALPQGIPAKRPVFGQRRKTLDLNAARPGYVSRWINDEPGRVDYAKECGYEHITDAKTKKPIFRVVDRTTGMKAYAMEIPQEFFDQAFAEKQRTNDAIDEAIMSRPIADAGYRPTIGNTLQPRTQAQVIRGR